MQCYIFKNIVFIIGLAAWYDIHQAPCSRTNIPRGKPLRRREKKQSIPAGQRPSLSQSWSHWSRNRQGCLNASPGRIGSPGDWLCGPYQGTCPGSLQACPLPHWDGNPGAYPGCYLGDCWTCPALEWTMTKHLQTGITMTDQNPLRFPEK